MTRLKLNIPLDVCYGSLSLFTSILHNVFLLYHVDIFVSVYKIDKASFWIGEAVFLLWNSCNDPLFGWLSDKKYLSKKRKSVEDEDSQIILNRLAALRRNGPLFALSFLAFWISWAYPSIQFVVCLCLYDGFLTMIDLHHNALLADLAVSAKVRTKLNSKCSIFSALGSASVFLSYSFWNKESLMTFRLFCTFLALFSLAGFLVSSNLLRKAYNQRKKNDDAVVFNRPAVTELESDSMVSDTDSLKKYVRQLMKQKNFLWFSLMNLIQVFHCHFNSNFFPLFLENLLGDSISPGFGSFLLGISFVAPHINNLYFLSLCQRYGVYAVIRFLFIIKLLISVLMFTAGPTHLWLLCLFIASNRVFTEGTCRLLNLVISDLVDEDYVLHKRTQAVSALMFGTAALLSKPGQTFAPLIGTWLLSHQTGHDIFSTGNEVGAIKLDLSQMDPETATAHREGCFTILVYIPIVCALVQLFTWSRFNLHGKRLNMVKSIRAGSHYATV